MTVDKHAGDFISLWSKRHSLISLA